MKDTKISFLCSRFFYDTAGNVVVLNFDNSVPIPKYDDVVDRSTFRPNSEAIRQSVISGSGFTSRGIFDDPNNPPSDVAVLVRSGKLDRAEVDDYLRMEESRVAKEADEAIKKSELNDKIKEIKDASFINSENKIGVNNASN